MTSLWFAVCVVALLLPADCEGIGYARAINKHLPDDVCVFAVQVGVATSCSCTQRTHVPCDNCQLLFASEAPSTPM